MIKEIYGKKIGMTQVFSEEGGLLSVTLLEIEPICVLEKVKYNFGTKLRIGCFQIQEKKINKVKKPVRGYFNKLKVPAYKLIREVLIEKDVKKADQDKGEAKTKDTTSEGASKIGIEIFNEGDVVDIRAKSKGKGFTGGMKRHNWKGQPGGHGSTMHRRPGSIGSSAYPSRVIKGRSMPGHMGNTFVTIKNLKVVRVDKDKNVLFVKGGVPGARGAVVKVRKV